MGYEKGGISMKKFTIIYLTLFIAFAVNPHPISLSGKWEQLKGLDGGDMHFLYATKDGILFLSHGFGGVWRSTDRGKHWELIKQEDFVDTIFFSMAEKGNLLYAGTNKGLWVSKDRGETWKKIITGFDEVDSGRYPVFSLAIVGDKLFFSAVLEKSLRRRQPGLSKIFCLYPDGKIRQFPVPEGSNLEAVLAGKYPYLFLSSIYSGLYVYSFQENHWKKLLSTKTTRVFVDDNYDLYVGTFGDWYYIGRKTQEGWKWEKITIPLEAFQKGRGFPRQERGYRQRRGKFLYQEKQYSHRQGFFQKEENFQTFFHFLLPDPVNEKYLWFGAGGIGGFYTISARKKGISFTGTGFYEKGKWLSLNISSRNYAHSLVFLPGEKIYTQYGEITKTALITQAGKGCVERTEDGGKTWIRSYEGVYGDTVNAVNIIKKGLLKGYIVCTAVSGIEIATDYGDKWIPGIDFTLGPEIKRKKGKHFGQEGFQRPIGSPRKRKFRKLPSFGYSTTAPPFASLGQKGFELPGYSWCAISPPEKIKGKYDLLISTGYPTAFGRESKGDGVFAFSFSSLKTGQPEKEKLLSGPHYEMIIVEGKLYAGNMEGGVDILDLKTFAQGKIALEGAGNLVREFDGKIFIATYKRRALPRYRQTASDGKPFYMGDMWRMQGEDGGIYFYDHHSGELKRIYSGYVISFFIKDNQLLALTPTALVFKPTIFGEEEKRVEFQEIMFSDMAVDWENGIIFLSNFDSDTAGVFWMRIEEVKNGILNLRNFTHGLLTNRVRNLSYYQGYLFAGTQGLSVWRVKAKISK